MTALPPGFFARPFAHRALHDLSEGRVENSLSAIAAAVAGDYGIEIDVQLSRDGEAMVFHDYDLQRLTDENGAVVLHDAAELGRIALRGGGGDCIPTLPEVLAQVEGRVPLLIEIKDQQLDLRDGARIGPLEAATARALVGYGGPVALMSFNPASMAHIAVLAPDVPRGLTTCGFLAEEWPLVPEAERERLRAIPDYESVGASFISHQHDELSMPRVAALKAAGAEICCWTVRSPEAEAAARQIAHSVTFEGYIAPLPDRVRRPSLAHDPRR